MNLALDAQTGQRIQREIDLGHYRKPAEVISHALDLLQAEEDWLLHRREEINLRLAQSLWQAAEGKTLAPEEARRILAKRRAFRDR